MKMFVAMIFVTVFDVESRFKKIIIYSCLASFPKKNVRLLAQTHAIKLTLGLRK